MLVIKKILHQQNLQDYLNKHITNTERKYHNLSPDAEAVLKDMQTDINMPFVLKYDRRTQEFDLIAKTVMRKKGFKTTSDVLSV